MQFYKKRFNILSQLGVSKFGILLYYIPQIILFVMVSWFLYYVTPTILKYGFNAMDQIRFDIYNKNLVYASEKTIWMIIVLNLFVFILEKIWLIQTRLIKVVQTLLVMIVCFAFLNILCILQRGNLLTHAPQLAHYFRQSPQSGNHPGAIAGNSEPPPRRTLRFARPGFLLWIHY